MDAVQKGTFLLHRTPVGLCSYCLAWESTSLSKAMAAHSSKFCECTCRCWCWAVLSFVEDGSKACSGGLHAHFGFQMIILCFTYIKMMGGRQSLSLDWNANLSSNLLTKKAIMGVCFIFYKKINSHVYTIIIFSGVYFSSWILLERLLITSYPKIFTDH